ncbi:MAG: Crp/Fnr family transcriptional regulator [Allosphingosinicella sp.]
MSSTSNPLVLLLRKLEAHSTLDEDDRRAILALPSTLKALDAQAYLVREGDAPGACAVVASGFACRHKQTADGARQIVALHIPGDPLDLQGLFLDVADHSVQMLTRAELAMIPRTILQGLIRARPGVGRAFLVLTLVEDSILREWVLNIGRRGAAARLAPFRCARGGRLEAQGLAGGDGYELPMTQEQLGDALGLTPVHVNRTLRVLESLGFVERQRRRVRIADWRRMRDYGDFNPRYLHLGRTRAGVSPSAPVESAFRAR